MKTVRLTASGAIVAYLTAQRIEVDDLGRPPAADEADGDLGHPPPGAAAGADGDLGHPPPVAAAEAVGGTAPLFGGVFAIFGHGNVTCLGADLEAVQDALPTWRGQNEQGMALAAVAYAKAHRRRRIMVATSSIGPGATNMVTAAAAAMANRLPLLLLAGDTFGHRVPDPVLQQVEHFGAPATTVNDSFRAVVRYWDRITDPAQVVHALPNAVNTMLDPADCGPAFIALPQDVQGQAYDYPARFFAPTVHRIRRPRPDRAELAAAAAALSAASRPLIIAGGGVRWSGAEAALAAFAEAHNIPVVETVAGRTSMAARHRLNCGPIGVTGAASANALAAEADAVLAVGTRLGDFVTGSWTVFADPEARIVAVNTARFDATKHRCLPVVADAREALAELGAALGRYRAPEDWSDRAAAETSQYHAYIDKIAAASVAGRPAGSGGEEPVTYAQVVGAVDRAAAESTYVVTAAGGLPGELVAGWRSETVGSFDCEYGYSCMGYEISGGWGAKMAMPDREVVVLVGDGSYLMMNSDLHSSVLTGHKLIVIVCDNGGYAVINRLQTAQGGAPFNNLIADCRTAAGPVGVDFAAHAASMGCLSETVATAAELEAALGRARAADRTYVIALRTDPYAWTEGGSFWEVGVPETHARPAVAEARAAMDAGKRAQRVGW